MGRLDGKVAIITGGARGMGEEHCRAFVAEGAKVILTDLLEAEGQTLAAELGRDAMFVAGDVSEPELWRRMTIGAEARFNRIDILVNNAGVTGPFASTTELQEVDYQRICAINQHAIFLGMQFVIPVMMRGGGGSIVNISSIAGLRAVPGSPNIAYVGSKFAVRGMSKAAAVEFGAHGVRVNSVHPGLIRTAMLTSGGEAFVEGDAPYLRNIPLRRVAEPAEITKLVLFLASDDASYITGAEIAADGGLTAS
jgi:3alpha(or 20beta)-hydroxysteroid dehydrogenase